MNLAEWGEQYTVLSVRIMVLRFRSVDPLAASRGVPGLYYQQRGYRRRPDDPPLDSQNEVSTGIYRSFIHKLHIIRFKRELLIAHPTSVSDLARCVHEFQPHIIVRTHS